MTDFRIDRRLVDAFVTGQLDDAGEAVLADEVARIIPFHIVLPNPMVAVLSRVTDHLGGQPALFAWLDRHPGRPRLVARLYQFVSLLDELTEQPAVVTALRELRARTPYPPGLEDYLVPDTDKDTLTGLAQAVENLLGEDRTGDAVRLADATAAMLQRIAPRVTDLDPQLRDKVTAVEHVRDDVLAATGTTRPGSAPAGTNG
jgi:hypothetical protein